MTADSSTSRSFVQCEKKYCCQRSAFAATWGILFVVIERLKRFVNVHLHCIVSNLKTKSKMSTLPTTANISADAHACVVCVCNLTPAFYWAMNNHYVFTTQQKIFYVEVGVFSGSFLAAESEFGVLFLLLSVFFKIFKILYIFFSKYLISQIFLLTYITTLNLKAQQVIQSIKRLGL